MEITPRIKGERQSRKIQIQSGIHRRTEPCLLVVYTIDEIMRTARRQFSVRPILIIKSGRSPFEALSYFIDRQKMEFEHRKRIVEQVQNGEMTKEAANSLFKSMGFEEIQ